MYEHRVLLFIVGPNMELHAHIVMGEGNETKQNVHREKRNKEWSVCVCTCVKVANYSNQ